MMISTNYKTYSLAGNNSNKSINKNTTTVSAVGETKRLKLQFIQNNPNAQPNSYNLQINPKTWPNLKVNDILEISSINSSNPSQFSGQLNSSLNRSAAINNSNNQGGYSLTTSTNQSNQKQQQQQQQQQQLNNNGLNDDESSPILFQVVQSSLNDSIQIDTIRIDSIASSAPYSFKPISYVYVTVIDKSNVVLDLVELLFKEQYFNGNDMLRIKKYMDNSCVYLKKNIEFCGMRCSVREMWAPNGDNVTCGYISEKTRLVFRSQSAMCTIYIQMSREMWEFDVNGEMYHEKAVNFLGELFTNWKNHTCSHDVTIALFSRIFYDAKSLDDFPSSISKHIKQDNKGRFYEDFYRVIYQNERFDDWTPTLVILKRLIKEYRDYILNYHKRQFGFGLNMPAGLLSSAAEGNFLETLILSSNVFERHFIDRPFDRTGMMSLVITPGNGLFEVSRELSKITKERVIDNAIGSDLVCLGEQPLHSVPLFKYDTSDTYDVPHWINLSFYKSSETVRYCNSKFLPSSKIKIKSKSKKLANSDSILPGYNPDKNLYSKLLEETDDMFEKVAPKSQIEQLGTNKKAPSRVNTSQNFQIQNNNQTQNVVLNQSDDDSSLELESDSEQNNSSQNEPTSGVGGGGGGVKKSKSKVNPFAPSSVRPRMSFERRRWAHTFPLRSDGTPIFQHWTSVQTNNEYETSNNSSSSFNSNNSNYMNNITNQINNTNQLKPGQLNQQIDQIDVAKVSPDSNKLARMLNKQLEISMPNKKSISNAKSIDLRNTNWEMVNKDETKALMRPGVAWKSLITPACLPLTTDFFPSMDTWVHKFIRYSDYSLLLDDIRDQYGYNNYHYNKISLEKVFYELVGHRLAMGFQMVVNKDAFTYNTNTNNTNTTNGGKELNQNNSTLRNFICDLSSSTSVTARTKFKSIKDYYKLSLGRIYHELFFIVDNVEKKDYINVEIYKPDYKKIKAEKGGTGGSGIVASDNKMKDDKDKDDREEKLHEYKYRFQVPDSKIYDVSFVKFTRKNEESIKWNLIDSYICIQGNGSLTPSDCKKCWRQRIYLIPIMYATSKLIVNKQQQSQQQQQQLPAPSQQQQNIINPSSSNQSNNSTTNLINGVQSTTPTFNTNVNSNNTSSSNQQQTTNNNNENNFLSLFNFNIQFPGIIPASMLENQTSIHCDIYQRKSNEELKFYRDYYFIKFMEHLNKLNRADDKRIYSKAAISYSEMINSSSSNATTSSQSTTNSASLLDQSVAVAVIMNSIVNNTSNLLSSSSSSSSSSATSAVSNQQQSSLSSAVTSSSSSSSNQNTTISSSNKINLSNSTLNIPNLAKSYLNYKQTFRKLTSPKQKLYPMVLKYLNAIETYKSLNDEAKKDITNIEKLKMQNDAFENEIRSYLNSEYTTHMLNSNYGLPFMQNKNDIPIDCFISAEAVWWCIEHINEIENEADAIVLMQIMSDFEQIAHISKEQNVFVHGFYLYYIITEENRNHRLYTKDYCEVGFCDLDLGKSNTNDEQSTNSIINVNYLLADSKSTLPICANEMYKSYLNSICKYSNSKFASTSPNSILKLVNVDVDSNHKSNRVEWASAVYRSNYHQLCAFELEIQWEMATGQLLYELASGWCKLANRFNYHIVAAPIDPFALPIVPNSDPLRGPIIIKLNINSLIQNECYLFESYIDAKYKLDFGFQLDEKFSNLNHNNNNNNNNETTTSNLSPSSLSTSSDSTSIVTAAGHINLDYLIENNKEFMSFIQRKNSYSDLSAAKKGIELKIQEEPDYIEQEHQEFIERKRIIRLQYFQEAILERFGFVKNAAIVKTLNSEEDPTFFIHSSGGMFVCLPNYYANYYTNRSRHTSSNTNNQTTTTTASALSKSAVNDAKHNNYINDFDSSSSRNSESHYVNEKSFNENHMANSPTTDSQIDPIDINNHTNSKHHIMNNSGKNSNNSFNSSLSNSYASNSTILNGHININNNNNNNNNNNLNGGAVSGGVGGGGGGTSLHNGYFHSNTSSNINNSSNISSSETNVRERSNTKSQHFEYLKLNDKNYFTNGSSSVDSENFDIIKKNMMVNGGQSETKKNEMLNSRSKHRNNKIENEIKNDLLFKPTTTTVITDNMTNDLRLLSGKSNEKLDLIQQQQREQMLLESNALLNQAAANNNNNNSINNNSGNDQSNNNQLNENCFLNGNFDYTDKRIPFYAEPDAYIGFSWSWNFMLGKRWRSQFTGDEAFQDNLLNDFRIFCSNQDGRLIKFYNEYKDYLE